MYKYAALLSLSLCACASTTPPVAQPSSILPPVVETAHLTANTDTVTVTMTETPITVELNRQRNAQVMRCSDELDCFQKLTGACPNGYNGGQTLHAGNERVVGILFKCITDAEKAELAHQEAEQKAQEAAWQAIRVAREAAALKDAQEAAQKTHPTTKTTPKK